MSRKSIAPFRQANQPSFAEHEILPDWPRKCYDVGELMVRRRLLTLIPAR